MRRAGALAALLAVACATDHVGWDLIAPRVRHPGFSYDRPAESDWYLLRSEQELGGAMLRRPTASATHTFYASVSLGELERAPTSLEDFVDLARSRGQVAKYEVRRISYDAVPVERDGHWCMRIDERDEAHGAPVAPSEALTMLIRGFRCLHPSDDRTTLDFFYSERGRADELDPALEIQGEAFLAGVRFEALPARPR